MMQQTINEGLELMSNDWRREMAELLNQCEKGAANDWSGLWHLLVGVVC